MHHSPLLETVEGPYELVLESCIKIIVISCSLSSSLHPRLLKYVWSATTSGSALRSRVTRHTIGTKRSTVSVPCHHTLRLSTRRHYGEGGGREGGREGGGRRSTRVNALHSFTSSASALVCTVSHSSALGSPITMLLCSRKINRRLHDQTCV